VTDLRPPHVGIGAAVRRVEDPRFLTGAGRFAGDERRAGLLHAAFVRSPHAHARIAAVDVAAAAAMPGVGAVYTGRDLDAAGVKPLPFAAMLKRRDGAPMAPPPRRALAADTVRHVGEAVAVVIAASEHAAADAAERVAVEWEELPAVADVRAGGEPCAWYEHGDAAAVDAAFAAATQRVRLELVNNRLVASPLEPRAALAEWDGGRLTLTLGCQMPHLARQQLGAILGLGDAGVRVVVGDIGGAFGAKSFLYPEYVAVAHAARVLGRPVRWVASRSESFLADTHGRDHATVAELALDAAGVFMALRVRTRANAGSYLSYLGAVIPTLAGTKPLSGAYRIPAIRVEVEVVLTHTAPVEAYRGAGRPETIYAIERLVDRAARVAGIDPVELRRRNFIGRHEMPYRTAMGETYDSGDFARVLDAALEASDWHGFARRRAEAARRGRLAGRGLAYFVESTGAANPVESAEVAVTGDAVTVYSGTQNMGQGLETAYAQIAAGRLGVPLERVRVVQGDTDRVARGGGSGGSRSLFVGGSAVLAACDRLVADAGPGPVDWFARARASGGRVAAEGKVKVPAFSWPNGCHVCEVEIDRETGAVAVTRFTAVDDVGVVVNPMIVHGQTHGGVAQGIGQALAEHGRYDPASGQLLTGSLADYALPRADDLPPFEVLTDESSPCTTNPLGAKGAGEGGAIGAPPAVVNAVLDALAPFGVAHVDMPATAETVWRALRERRNA
jgi:carbon-monoxide dehydrogenase large subunit